MSLAAFDFHSRFRFPLPLPPFALLDASGLPTRYIPRVVLRKLYPNGHKASVELTWSLLPFRSPARSWYWRPILNAIRQFKTRQIDDPHYQKMLVYKEVPMYVYGGIILVSFAMAMATCYTGNSQLPWWALIVAIILAACECTFRLHPARTVRCWAKRWPTPFPDSRPFPSLAPFSTPRSHVPLRLRHLRHHRLQDRRPAARADARSGGRAGQQSGQHVYVSL